MCALMVMGGLRYDRKMGLPSIDIRSGVGIVLFGLMLGLRACDPLSSLLCDKTALS
jgi:hypothetical protein